MSKASSSKRPAPSPELPERTARKRTAAEVRASSKHSAERLVELRREAFVTKTGLTHVLNDIRKNGIPEAISRDAQRRGLEKLCAQSTPNGPILQQVTVPRTDIDEPLIVHIQSPQAMM